jgi:hypothetical protein
VRRFDLRVVLAQGVPGRGHSDIGDAGAPVNRSHGVDPSQVDQGGDDGEVNEVLTDRINDRVGRGPV